MSEKTQNSVENVEETTKVVATIEKKEEKEPGAIKRFFTKHKKGLKIAGCILGAFGSGFAIGRVTKKSKKDSTECYEVEIQEVPESTEENSDDIAE